MAIAQYGIRPRDFAAATWGASGTAATVTGSAGTAAFTAGVAAAAGTGAADDSPPLAPDESPPEARRSRERFRRCSGISVTDQSFRGTRLRARTTPQIRARGPRNRNLRPMTPVGELEVTVAGEPRRRRDRTTVPSGISVSGHGRLGEPGEGVVVGDTEVPCRGAIGCVSDPGREGIDESKETIGTPRTCAQTSCSGRRSDRQTIVHRRPPPRSSRRVNERERDGSLRGTADYHSRKRSRRARKGSPAACWQSTF